MDFWGLSSQQNPKIVFCNFYKYSKQANIQDVISKDTKALIDIIRLSTNLTINKETTLVTESGDWGVKKLSHPKFNQCNYVLSNTGTLCFSVEIDSIINSVGRWFMTNMGEYLGENVYPIPIKINHVFNINKAREIKKTKFCYANFSITSCSRIRVAEWAWRQKFIDCNFPKVYESQDVDLDMHILKGEKLNRKDFIKTLASYEFAIAPTGNGLDTYRTWECIFCNTVPIVQDNWMNRVFSKIWPMILVHKYEYTNVLEKIEEFKNKYGQIKYDYELLLEQNIETLLNRIQYESDRLRRETS
jgi:hypothetical protein